MSVRPPRRFGQRLLVPATWTVCLLAAAAAQATIHYEVSVANPEQHFLRVAVTIPDVQDGVTLQMPAWNALYQIRDFGSRVTNFRAFDSSQRPVAVTRLDKNTWRIEGRGEVRAEYSIYWDDPGPFASQLNGEHAFLNLAMVLCYVPERRHEDVTVRFLRLPAGWRATVELEPVADGLPGEPPAAFRAADYDSLTDAPVEIGPFDPFLFQAAGRPIRVVVHGGPADRARLTETLRRIIEYQTQLMGDAPFPAFTFIYHIGRNFGGGGMEHANSTAIAIPSEATLANISAHEFFHLWNVKRIRPQSLEPVEHTREMWTRSLWFAEGVTSAYAAWTMVRTGLWSREQFLTDLAQQITELRGRPAHLWQSAEESSLNTWLDKYDLYNRPEFSVSYYNKGQLLGVGLDILIRDATDNRASLDDVLRQLNRDYAQRGRFYEESEAIRAAAEAVIRAARPGAPADLGDFFRRYVAGTEELPMAEWLERAGLVLRERNERRAALGFTLVARVGGDLVVAGLDAASPAARAGLREGQVVAALDGDPPPPDLERWLRERRPGDPVRVTVRHSEAETELSFALAGATAPAYFIEELPQATAKQARIREGMLRGRTDAAAGAAAGTR